MSRFYHECVIFEGLGPGGDFYQVTEVTVYNQLLSVSGNILTKTNDKYTAIVTMNQRFSIHRR